MTGNAAASVHQRLLNRARATDRPFNELLQYFALERFLYRLGQSPYAGHFVLKGALMFAVWQGPYARSTRDIDLLGRIENSPERVIEAMQVVCQVEVAVDDGLRFQPDSISAERITEAADYQGLRVVVPALLGSARILVRVDVGFGDALTPGPIPVRLPTILDFPAPTWTNSGSGLRSSAAILPWMRPASWQQSSKLWPPSCCHWRRRCARTHRSSAIGLPEAPGWRGVCRRSSPGSERTETRRLPHDPLPQTPHRSRPFASGASRPMRGARSRSAGATATSRPCT